MSVVYHCTRKRSSWTDSATCVTMRVVHNRYNIIRRQQQREKAEWFETTSNRFQKYRTSNITRKHFPLQAQNKRLTSTFTASTVSDSGQSTISPKFGLRQGKHCSNCHRPASLRNWMTIKTVFSIVSYPLHSRHSWSEIPNPGYLGVGASWNNL